MRRPCKSLGLFIVGAGLLLILAIILSTELWWLLLGLGLILAGILLIKC